MRHQKQRRSNKNKEFKNVFKLNLQLTKTKYIRQNVPERYKGHIRQAHR